MKIGIYPGSFDPITNGHLDIIERGLKICDKLIIALLYNPNKKSFFSVEERIEQIKIATKNNPNIEVDSFTGLLTDYAKSKNARIIIRGLRAVSDFEYEFQMALMNKKLHSDMETIFLMTSPKNSYLSSSLVKEIASHNGCIKGFVPQNVESDLKNRNILKK